METELRFVPAWQCRPRSADLRIRSVDSLRTPFGLPKVVYLA